MDCRVKPAMTKKESVMAYWLLKTEPETFSWDDQVKKGAEGEAWTGVRNFRARSHLKAMRKGERAFFYHTGDEKRIVGIVEVIREAYKDPTDEEGKFLCVDVKAVAPVAHPVTLAAVRAEKRLKDMVLVHQPRLSVQPVTAEEWAIVCDMAGVKA
jgi:predicted RNA-binding protein with PUA-like domain